MQSSTEEIRNTEKIKLINLLASMRKLSSIYLPINHSFIPYDILLIVYLAHIQDKKLTVKELFNNLKYSDMGVRYHFKRLIKDEWIVLSKSTTDSRAKICQPTNKCIEHFDNYIAEFSSNFENFVK
jgi:DNA-binding MarR family transcriptional regulator